MVLSGGAGVKCLLSAGQWQPDMPLFFTKYGPLAHVIWRGRERVGGWVDLAAGLFDPRRAIPVVERERALDQAYYIKIRIHNHDGVRLGWLYRQTGGFEYGGDVVEQIDIIQAARQGHGH